MSKPTHCGADSPRQLVIEIWNACAYGQITNVTYSATGANRNPITNGYLPCRMTLAPIDQRLNLVTELSFLMASARFWIRSTKASALIRPNISSLVAVRASVSSSLYQPSKYRLNTS